MVPVIDDQLIALLQRAEQRHSLPSPRVRRLIRERAHASQQELASVIGVTGPTIARWESGTRNPSGDRLRRYVQVLSALQALG